MDGLVLEGLLLRLGGTHRSIRLQALSSATSFIANPAASASSQRTRSTLSHALAQRLLHEKDPILLHHVLNLLGLLFCLHNPNAAGEDTPSLLIHDAVHVYLRTRGVSNKRLGALALALLVLIAQHSSLPVAVEPDLLLSLLLSSVTRVRLWLVHLLAATLQNQRHRTARVAGVGALTFRVFLGLTTDPYPLVRKAALDALIILTKTGHKFTDECYDRAVGFLRDGDYLVRLSSVQLISEWGEMLAAANGGADHGEQLDVLFLQLCWMVRDMSMDVRIEALRALGKTKHVSEDILLQSLCKKIVGIKYPRRVKEGFEFLISSAAGAFVHGLEDEFSEVRRATCRALASLTVFSKQFADDALNLLMDMLNDDSAVVRFQTLHAMFHMAVTDCLKVQEKHMHMFLTMLVDINYQVRTTAREVLRIMNLLDMDAFRSTINGLLTNLQAFPEDEQDVLSLLYCIGKNHGNFVGSFVNKFAQEIGPSCEGQLSLDSHWVAAVLMLAIGMQQSEQRTCDIPTRIFTCALPFLEKVTCSLTDVINRDCHLLCLQKCTRAMLFPVEPLNSEGHGRSLEVEGGSIEDYRQDWHEDITSAVRRILRTVAEIWPFVQSGSTNEALRVLRGCREELKLITSCSSGPIDALAFASEYVHAIRLLAQVWDCLSPTVYHVLEIDRFDLLLEKYDMCLKRIRYGFLGLSRGEELHLLELVLLSCVLRISKMGACCYAMLGRLRATLSCIELLCEKEASKLSRFIKELKQTCCEGNMKEILGHFPANKLLELFSLEQFTFSAGCKYIKAELDAPGNDSENPIPFIPGLPVGITFQVRLCNISSKNRVWLQMVVGELKQHVFIDFCLFGGSDEERRCTVDVPFYRTPRAASFSLRACVGLECASEDVSNVTQSQAGPKRELTMLCREEEVYLVMT